jgi:hypothetical protein
VTVIFENWAAAPAALDSKEGEPASAFAAGFAIALSVGILIVGAWGTFGGLFSASICMFAGDVVAVQAIFVLKPLPVAWSVDGAKGVDMEELKATIQ